MTSVLPLSDNQKGLIRVVVYPIMFEPDPVAVVDRVLNHVVFRNDDKARDADEMLAAIEAGIAGQEKLAELLPQDHPESTIRRYLTEAARRLRARGART